MCYDVLHTHLACQRSFCDRKESEVELFGRHVDILYFIITYLLFTDVVRVEFMYGIAVFLCLRCVSCPTCFLFCQERSLSPICYGPNLNWSCLCILWNWCILEILSKTSFHLSYVLLGSSRGLSFNICHLRCYCFMFLAVFLQLFVFKYACIFVFLNIFWWCLCLSHCMWMWKTFFFLAVFMSLMCQYLLLWRIVWILYVCFSYILYLKTASWNGWAYH